MKAHERIFTHSSLFHLEIETESTRPFVCCRQFPLMCRGDACGTQRVIKETSHDANLHPLLRRVHMYITPSFLFLPRLQQQLWKRVPEVRAEPGTFNVIKCAVLHPPPSLEGNVHTHK